MSSSSLIDYFSPLYSQLCNAFMQLGARGVSIIVTSGNVAQTEGCSDFVPTFPSDCPFVTSVGNTVNFPPKIKNTSTFGGFSNIFPQPSYQSTLVDNYLTSIETGNARLLDSVGRAFPDVSALAMQVVNDFNFATDTYLSACTFSNVIVLLNDGLVSRKKPAMGFLNPLLYGVATDIPIFNDVALDTPAGF